MNMYDANSVVKVLESVNTNWLSDGFTHTQKHTHEDLVLLKYFDCTQFG